MYYLCALLRMWKAFYVNALWVACKQSEQKSHGVINTVIHWNIKAEEALLK